MKRQTARYLVHLPPGSGGKVTALHEDGIFFIPRRRCLLERLRVVSRAHPRFWSRTGRHDWLSHVTSRNRSRLWDHPLRSDAPSGRPSPASSSDMAADPIPRGLDPDVRPLKRPRLPTMPTPMAALTPPSCSSPLTPLPSPKEKPLLSLRPLPLPLLLLSLPAILILPPSHHLHDESLRLSMVALRKCLLIKALSPEIECRAWTTLAQVGLQAVGSQLSASSHERHAWARNIEAEVRAITRSLWASDQFTSRSIERSLRVYVAFLPESYLVFMALSW